MNEEIKSASGPLAQFCSACGNKLQDGMKFCGGCGLALDTGGFGNASHGDQSAEASDLHIGDQNLTIAQGWGY
ncbi:hypothetical protein AEP_01633 [Curvibacter sp. AEP1-3]|uniref:zinc-ribbon domain-containing protein n=1 Tax=Curvibacter sp. AEP1-3 TaxID=1844971 RepID=UPI000B553F23|nr:zinc ribbon domain-containing protein [Curvibacter sp. AEP1-3]ARV18577.1 hypothetical protein AEP_01633 [Curvibacter sp. AEP1-3]